jgi:hypothetical protein
MLRMLISVCVLVVVASTFLPTTPRLVTPLDQDTLPLAAWLGALSMIAGAVSQKGPHVGL